MSIEKQRCPKELFIERYFCRQFNERDKIDADFGMLTDLLDSYEQEILANPSELGLVKESTIAAALGLKRIQTVLQNNQSDKS